MMNEQKSDHNIQQVVPFFAVTDIVASLRFYVQGLGFEMKYEWIQQEKLTWCWLENGGAAIMLQQHSADGHEAKMTQARRGDGVAIYFICLDALEMYHNLRSRGIQASRPFVGNGMWVTGVTDPDGYVIHFESPTDQPEETEYGEDA